MKNKGFKKKARKKARKKEFKVVIPARYASSRLPGKPLCLIAGKPMIQHTYERALLSQAKEVVIATDDQRIVNAVKEFTDNVVLTSSEHNSGTERLAEVMTLTGWSNDTIVVNVQGDEPLVLADHINQVAQSLADNEDAGMATLATPIHLAEDIFNANIVKVVLDSRGYALYFSRAMIPWSREQFKQEDILNAVKNEAVIEQNVWHRHVGMYAYRGHVLDQYKNLNSCTIERLESLEQLRLLFHGIKIHVSIVKKNAGHGVDVLEDIAKVEKLLAKEN